MALVDAYYSQYSDKDEFDLGNRKIVEAKLLNALKKKVPVDIIEGLFQIDSKKIIS